MRKRSDRDADRLVKSVRMEVSSGGLALNRQAIGAALGESFPIVSTGVLFSSLVVL